MATGDILSSVVRADGWSIDVTIAGFVTGATYDFGSLASSPPTTATPKFSVAVVSEGYNSSGTLGTINRTLYGTHIVRVPATTTTIAGSYTTGTFTDGETVTQTTSGATAIIVGGYAAGALLRVKTVVGTPNTTNIWTGGISTATFTPTATPVALADGTKDEFNNGTNLIVRVSLNESIYLDDNIGAGKSGTAPTVTISAAWATNTGGASQTSVVATAAVVTNNSTLVYPKVIAQWAWGHTPSWKAVTTATSIGCIATHGHGIACIALSATDQHANVVSGTVTSKSAHLMSASGLYYESYDLTVPITGFTAGDDVTLKYIAYPLVGDAASIIDTSTNTISTDDVIGITLIKFRLPTTTAYLHFAATDHPTTPGNDTTGTGTSALPFATTGKALEAVTEAAGKLTIIYAKAGGTTLSILGSTPASVAATGCFIEVRPFPGDTVTLNRDAVFRSYVATKLLYTGFTFTGNYFIYGGLVPSAKLRFENCTFSPATPSSPGICYGSEGCYFVNCTWTTLDDLSDYNSTMGVYSHTGSYFAVGAVMGSQSTIVACKVIGAGADTVVVRDRSVTTVAPLRNIMYVNNQFMKCTISGSAVVSMNDNIGKTELALIGNIIEAISGTAQACLLFSASSQTLNNGICAHNTVIGERMLICYNDTGSTSVSHSNIFNGNNAFRSFNIKGDLFGTKDGRRTGNAATMNGVNCFDNRYDGTVDASFTGDYESINVAFVTGKTAVYGQLGYTIDASQDGTAAGKGDYRPVSGSVLSGHALKRSYITYDMQGNVITTNIGALRRRVIARSLLLMGVG